MKDLLIRMVTTNSGAISSKIIVGAFCYLVFTFVLGSLIFVNPEFPGIDNIVITYIVTTGGLLGLTTVENIKTPSNREEEYNENSEDI